LLRTTHPKDTAGLCRKFPCRFSRSEANFAARMNAENTSPFSEFFIITITVNQCQNIFFAKLSFPKRKRLFEPLLFSI